MTLWRTMVSQTVKKVMSQAQLNSSICKLQSVAENIKTHKTVKFLQISASYSFTKQDQRFVSYSKN